MTNTFIVLAIFAALFALSHWMNKVERRITELEDRLKMIDGWPFGDRHS